MFPLIGFQIATVEIAAKGHAKRTTSNPPTPTWASNLRKINLAGFERSAREASDADRNRRYCVESPVYQPNIDGIQIIRLLKITHDPSRIAMGRFT